MDVDGLVRETRERVARDYVFDQKGDVVVSPDDDILALCDEVERLVTLCERHGIDVGGDS